MSVAQRIKYLHSQNDHLDNMKITFENVAVSKEGSEKRIQGCRRRRECDYHSPSPIAFWNTWSLPAMFITPSFK